MDVCGVRHECRLRGTLKKSNKKDNCIVGDMVEIEEGAINQVYERENILYRPLVSNLSYIAITFAILINQYSPNIYDHIKQKRGRSSSSSKIN